MHESLARILELLKSSDLLGERRLLGVWVFGSHARGEVRGDSDVDLGVLCEPPLGLERTRWMEALSRAAGVEVDVIDLASTSATLAWEVITTGWLAVENDSLAVEQFLRRTRYEAEDEARRNRMIVLAEARRIGPAS